ncbi:MAG: TetR/AcrR family transcriptional regulator [Solirubrobacteraceae bacterium]|nr:TetR/AcrR family transcriptional regulator [Patulibacter sp.]
MRRCSGRRAPRPAGATPIPRPTASPIPPRSASDWLELGLELLRTRGPQSLTVDELCRRAGLTKGAFYHRFDGVAGYRDALLEHWHATTTDRVIEELRPTFDETDPHARRDALNRLVVHIDMGLERAIRSWGVYDPAVQEVINATDRKRVAAVTALAAPRATPEETHAAAAAEYSAYLGFVLMQDPETFGVLAKWGPRVVVTFSDDLTAGPLPPPDAGG